MNIIQISPFRFRELVKAHVPLDSLYLLQLAVQGLDLRDFKEKKIEVLIKGLQLKGFLDEQGAITLSGKQLWDSLFLEETEQLQFNRMKVHEDDFERFWKEFPATDTIKVEGKVVMKGSRNLKNDKDKCRIKFHQILSEGEYSADDIIRSLRYQLNLKIEKSLKDRKNELQYFKNSHAYLTQRAYEAFMEESKDQELKPIKKSPNWDAIA